MPDSIFRGVFCSFLAFLFYGFVLAQSPDRYVPPSKAQWDELAARAERIKEQLNSPGNPAWAGNYHWGSLGFSGQTLLLAPKAGYVFRPYTDYSPNDIEDKFDYGTIEETDGVIYLHSERRIFSEDRFYFITWGERHLLMPERYLPVLFNFVNAGCAEFQSIDEVGNLYFPTKDEEVRKKLFGKPVLRKEFEKFLFSSPVTGSIVAVGKSRIEKQSPDSPNHRWFNRYTSVTLNVGTSKGIWPGMLMFSRVPDISDAYIRLQVQKATENSAEGEIYHSFEGKEPRLPSVGLEFNTSLGPARQGQRIAPWECS